MTYLTPTQVEQWRNRQIERRNDADDIAYNLDRDKRRRVVRQEMLSFLDGFLSGSIDLPTFKEDFDRKTRKEWDVFGLKGPSGAMFLNTLVKHIPDQAAVAAELKRVLRLPGSAEQGRDRLTHFIDTLYQLIDDGIITRSQVQPVRALVFVSGWWHLQAGEEWPIYYLSARQTLAIDGLHSDTDNAVADYFAFREVFLELMSALALPAWEVEHLLAWYDAAPSIDVPVSALPTIEIPPLPTADDSEEGTTWAESTAHTRIQWLLAQLGRELNCQVWIASNDHNRTHEGNRLGSLSVASLPNLGMDSDTQQIIGLIDVIWLQGKKVAAAFEIESTTSIFSGILRMTDLLAVAPNLSFPLYLVVPEDRISAVRKQLCRETFKAMELPERCRYITFKDLQEKQEVIAQWATDPGAVRKLSHRADCESAPSAK